MAISCEVCKVQSEKSLIAYLLDDKNDDYAMKHFCLSLSVVVLKKC